MRAFKIFVLLIAILGIAAIGWYLTDRNGVMALLGEDSQGVKVQKISPPAPTGAGPAKPAATEAPAPKPAPTQTAASAMPAAAPSVPAAELAAMTPEQFADLYARTDIAVRAALLTDFVKAAGEQNSLQVIRRFSSGSVEGRKYDLSYALAQVTVMEYNSRLASYIAGTMALNGRGTEKDLDGAMRYLRHPELLDTAAALYFRAVILADPDYVNTDRQAAIDLLRKVVETADADDPKIGDAKKLLAELGAS